MSEGKICGLLTALMADVFSVISFNVRACIAYLLLLRRYKCQDGDCDFFFREKQEDMYFLHIVDCIGIITFSEGNY